jgi:4-amino-4-deoxy-L-arabinose transferase-like glycosyltransferase
MWKKRSHAGVGAHCITALSLSVLAIVFLTATAPDIGLTWDEPAYIAASESYVAWFDELLSRPGYALSAQGIRYHWTLNHEHPPLDKVWSGLVWDVARAFLDDLTAHRLGNILLVGALVALVYLMAALGPPAHLGGSEGGRLIAGLAAAVALISMPRFFFHAHLAALDVPAAVTVYAVVALFWATRNGPALRWDLALGLLWGLGMGFKISAIFVPVTLLLWLLLFCRRRYLFRRLIVMGLVGVPLMLILWPWLYYETIPRILEYILFVTVDHWKIGQWYLGRFYMPPPWHFGFVITFAVVPLSLTLLYALGILRTIVDACVRPLGGLLILCALVPMLALAIGQSMVYDNDRLFMPSFPYLATLAGLGFAWGVQRINTLALTAEGSLARPRSGSGDPERARPSKWLFLAGSIVTLAALTIPHIHRASTLYPHLLSYYSEAVGGLSGATRLGLETTYWCETYAQALPYLNAYVRPGDVVWVQAYSHDVMIYYQLHGQLEPCAYLPMAKYAHTVFDQQVVPWMSPSDTSLCPAREGWHSVTRRVTTSIWDADYVVLQYRQTGFDHEIRRFIQTQEPVYRLTYRGIPLMEVYAPQKPPPLESPPGGGTYPPSPPWGETEGGRHARSAGSDT